MKIISKASFCFGPGLKRDGSVEKFVTIPSVIQEMPDKFANDDLFKDCVRLGLVSILGEQAVPVVDQPDANDVVDDPQAELSEYLSEVRAMSHDELVEEAEAVQIELTGNETDKQIRKSLANNKKKELGI